MGMCPFGSHSYLEIPVLGSGTGKCFNYYGRYCIWVILLIEKAEMCYIIIHASCDCYEPYLGIPVFGLTAQYPPAWPGL